MAAIGPATAPVLDPTLEAALKRSLERIKADEHWRLARRLERHEAAKEAAKAQDEAAKAQMEFYNAVRPSAFILGFITQSSAAAAEAQGCVLPPPIGRSITSAEGFQALVKEAEDEQKNLFFHVATVKPTWTGGTTATKDQILECPYLWGDCDPDHTKNGAQNWYAIEKELKRLGITPFAVWSGAATRNVPVAVEIGRQASIASGH